MMCEVNIIIRYNSEIDDVGVNDVNDVSMGVLVCECVCGSIGVWVCVCVSVLMV